MGGKYRGSSPEKTTRYPGKFVYVVRRKWKTKSVKAQRSQDRGREGKTLLIIPV
jgi:hypothetical protein